MTADEFDPYHKWLAIPKQEQPPNHYRLLGLPLYESDLEVILSSTDRQMAHVKAQASGKNMEHSQRILRELAEAGRCLMTAERKQEYDTNLRKEIERKEVDDLIGSPSLQPAPQTPAPQLSAPQARTPKVSAPKLPLSQPVGRRSAPQPAAGRSAPTPPPIAPAQESAAQALSGLFAPAKGVFGPAPPPPPPPGGPVSVLTAADLESGAREAPGIDLRAGQKREESELDMTPMVDVTFLLLIFFMVTASFTMQKALIVPTPKEKEQPSVQTIDDLEEDPHYIIVRIDQYNGFHVETPGSDNEAPSEHDLMLELRRARRTPIDGVVPSKLLIMADIDSLHEKAVAAIDIGMEVGMEQVQMTTVEEEE